MGKEQELLPLACPFCGGTDKLKVTPYMAGDDGGEPFAWGFTVVCNAAGFAHVAGRGCGGSGAWGETEAEAIAAWNRRSSSDEAEVVAKPIGWLETLPPHDPVYGAKVEWRDDDAVLKLPNRTPLYASPSGVKAGVTEAQREAVKKAIRAALTDRLTDSVNMRSWDADMLLAGCSHYQGTGYEKPAEAADKLASDAADAAIRALGAGDEGMGPDLLAELAKHVCWSIERGHEDSSDDEFSRYGWCVHEVSGNRSDREWRLIGFGETPREALSLAIQGDAK